MRSRWSAGLLLSVASVCFAGAPAPADDTFDIDGFQVKVHKESEWLVKVSEGSKELGTYKMGEGDYEGALAFANFVGAAIRAGRGDPQFVVHENGPFATDAILIYDGKDPLAKAEFDSAERRAAAAKLLKVVSKSAHEKFAAKGSSETRLGPTPEPKVDPASSKK